MGREGVLGRLLTALVQAVIVRDLNHTRVIIREAADTAGGLALTVRLMIVPAGHCRVILPEGQAEQLVGVSEAAKALHRDEARNLFQLWPQPRGVVEVLILLPGCLARR